MIEKIARNVERDRQTDVALQRDGWSILRTRDFETVGGLESVVERIVDACASARACVRTGNAAGRATQCEYRLLGGNEKTSRTASVGFGETVRTARLRPGSGADSLSRGRLEHDLSGLYGNTIAAYECVVRATQA